MPTATLPQNTPQSTFLPPPPPPPLYPDPRREKRGLLRKLESRLGIRSWASKLVVADEVTVKYYSSGNPGVAEVPRKTLKTAQCIFSKMPVASKYFRPHSFQVEDSFNQYVATFSCEGDDERDDWLSFLSSLGRMRRLNTLIEQEIEQIKVETECIDFDLIDDSANPLSPTSGSTMAPPPNSTTVNPSTTDRKPSGSPDQIKSSQTIFISRVYDLFIHEDVGKVEVDDLAVLLLHLGKPDSMQFVKGVESIVDPNGTGSVDKNIFVKW